MAKNQGFSALADLQSKLAESTTETETSNPIEPAQLDPETPTVSNDEIPETPVELEEIPEEITDEAEPELDTVVKDEDPVDEPEQETPPPTLNEIPVNEWTTEQLVQYITGDTELGVDFYHATVVKAIAEHLVRSTDLSAAWSLQEVKDFLTQGVVPAKTSKGAWLKDVTRASRRESDWSTQELESWALGEIVAEGATLDAGLAIELKKRLGLKVPGVDVKDVILNYKTTTAPKPEIKLTPAVVKPVEPVVTAPTETVEPTIYPSLTKMNQSYLENSLASFAKVLQPGRSVTEVDGGAAQKLLMQTFNYAIGLEDPQASKSGMQLIFDFIKARRGVGQLFEDTYAFRFIENMRSTATEQRNHAALLTLFITYADEATELRAQTDVPSLIKGVSPSHQSRLLEFFSKV